MTDKDQSISVAEQLVKIEKAMKNGHVIRVFVLVFQLQKACMPQAKTPLSALSFVPKKPKNFTIDVRTLQAMQKCMREAQIFVLRDMLANLALGKGDFFVIKQILNQWNAFFKENFGFSRNEKKRLFQIFHIKRLKSMIQDMQQHKNGTPADIAYIKKTVIQYRLQYAQLGISRNEMKILAKSVHARYVTDLIVWAHQYGKEGLSPEELTLVKRKASLKDAVELGISSDELMALMS